MGHSQVLHHVLYLFVLYYSSITSVILNTYTKLLALMSGKFNSRLVYCSSETGRPCLAGDFDSSGFLLRREIGEPAEISSLVEPCCLFESHDHTTWSCCSQVLCWWGKLKLLLALVTQEPYTSYTSRGRGIFWFREKLFLCQTDHYPIWFSRIQS